MSTITRVRILLEHCRIEGDMHLVEGGTVDSALAHVITKDSLTLDRVICFACHDHSILFKADQTVINPKQIVALHALENSGIKGDVELARVAAMHGATKVEELMSTRILTVRTADDVKEAFRLMTANRIRHLPVVEKNHLIGLVSDRDLRTFLLSGNAMTIEEILVPLVRLKTTSPKATVKAANDIMLANKISCLPVLDEGRLVGLITESDMLEYLKTLLHG